MPAGRAASSQLETLPIGTESTTLFKACADCGDRIPQEHAVILSDPQDPENTVVICSNCRWKRLGMDPTRPPHALGRSPPVFSQEIPLSSEYAYISSLGNSRSALEDRVCACSAPQIPRSQFPEDSQLNVTTPFNTPTTFQNSTRLETSSGKSTEHQVEPSPHTDITRLRVKRTGKYCLYPGSTFRGVQKSGRSDYGVTVTILDVDFTTSFLCGYLEIRGLTETWPELTTYFDAEIIGAQYSFLTRGWGSTHEDDRYHWEQFPAYNSKEIQTDLQFPRYTLREESGHRDRQCLFMRWKERFLVPDHRVKDINGASFAGFYYICVEYEPFQHVDSQVESILPNDEWRSPPASMTGFYFHKNSEPYQQLCLRHVPDEESGIGNGSFEWR